MIQTIPDDLRVTPEEAGALELDAIVAAAESPLIWQYLPKVAEARDGANAQGDERRAVLLQLVIEVLSFSLSDDVKQPFRPMVTLVAGGRSSLPEDISDGQATALEVLLESISDPELRARVADTLWSRAKRDVRHARIAIEAYLASARRLFDPNRWPWPVDRLRRADAIARLLGAGGSAELEAITSQLWDTLRMLKGSDVLYFSERVMVLLANRSLERPEIEGLKALAASMAAEAAQARDFRRMRAYLSCELTWTKALEDYKEFSRIRLEIAESHVSEAQVQGSNTARASTLRVAVQELRNAHADQGRIESVRALLDDAQRLSLSELTTVAIPFDPSELVEAARADVQGVPAIKGFWKLAVLVPISKKSDLRERAERSIEQSVFLHGFNRTHLTQGGRLTGTTPGALGADTDEREELLKAAMREEAERLRLLAVHGVIEPMRQELVRQHNYSLQDLYFALRGRLFIPHDREMIWTYGLHAGLHGDYMTAVHLLVPQLEHSFRWILELQGVLPYKQYQNGVQDVFKLEDSLSQQKLVATLGEDVVFQIESLLTGRTSSNLRNLLSHGLLSYGQTVSHDSAYCWWLALYLVAHLGKLPAELLKVEAEPAAAEATVVEENSL
jgi:hypothetical protein